ncbi:MAG: response regulator [Deltaproteobacteria bacterium]|nr:response regulator [Deltaproteobacteria bacterium]
MTHKILVVDDNSATRRMVRNALVRNGHSVLEAPDGRTARELMAKEQPRVVLQDLMLPDADGFELVGQLRDIAKSDVSILAFSGFVSKLDEAHASTVGFDDIIPKPIAPSRLVPLIEAHLPSQAPRAERFGSGRLLVVADDDPLQLKLASFRLSRLGFEVETAGNGAEALAILHRRRADAVVSDVMMPELDGFGLAMAVRQDPKLRDIPLVLVTSSYVEPADRELARRAGANDLVVRTPELGELIEMLRTTLAGSGSGAANPVEPESLPELEREHNRHVFRQLERQVMLNTGLAKRCSALASELTVLTGISEAVLRHRDVDVALDEALATCFDAGGVAVGALYLLDANGQLRARPLGGDPKWPPPELGTFFGREALLRTVMATGKPMFLPSQDVPADIAAELLRLTEASALLVVPLTTTAGPLGALLMIARAREVDREDWRAFAVGVGTQISQVLTLARAYADRERAEQDAARHAALLEAVVESAPDYVLQLDLEGRIQFVNRTDAPTDPASLIGVSWFERILIEDQRERAREAFDRVVATGQPAGFEIQLPRGALTRWFQGRFGAVKQAGKIVGCVLVARDVTDLKQTELQLMLADRMASVGTLAAGVAHEINNPLAAVIANLDMAVQDVEGLQSAPPDLGEELKDARSAADRVREIVRDLKIFSRVQEERRGAVDIQKVLDSTLRMAWNEIRHRAKLVKSYTKTPRVDGNESRLGQVFLNLIVNAVQAMPEGNVAANELRIATSHEGNHVVITVSDTGGGMPPEVQARLFTPFFTTKPTGVGTGLGLAISHRIITSLGGSITFTSAPGAGTEFRVALPIAAPDLPPITERLPLVGAATRRGTVLVVDDEESLGQAIRRFLANDHEVSAVTNGRDALTLIESGGRYDLILCDLMMPQMTGMELHDAVMAVDPDQARRMVFLTGGAFTQSAREFMDAVPNRRLEKPFDLKLLRNLVNELIG